MPALRTVLTERLLLTRPEPGDLDGLHDLHADPRVWTHLPSGRHTRRGQTRDAYDVCRDGWEANGLDYWVLRVRDDEDRGPIGMGGCSRRELGWNLYYRLSPDAWGRGYAQELVAASVAAAREVRPDLSVIAYLLEHNEGSKRTAERSGFELVWRGPDAGNPDSAAVRLVYADREVGPDVVRAFST